MKGRVVVALEVVDLWVGYDGLAALEGVSLRIEAGTLVGVVGPNGSGKSTFLKSVLGLLRPKRGRLLVLGVSPREARRCVGYVPQSEEVAWDFPVTVRDVVMMGRYPGLGMLRWPSGVDRELVDASLSRVGMRQHADVQIGRLSGGQRQRVFLARALAQQSDLLLLDEPVTGVDAPSQHEVFALLEELRAGGKTILVATHDLSCVTERFDMVLCLNRRVIAFGPPKEVLTKPILNETYGWHLLLTKVGEQVVAGEESPDGGCP